MNVSVALSRRSAPAPLPALAERLALARAEAPEGVHGPPLPLMLGELEVFAEPFRRITRRMEIPPARNPRLVMLLPGFATHPIRMRYMAQQLERAGHKAKRWGMGFNLGASEEAMESLSERIVAVHERYGRKAVLVGWSLGGIFAREMAKRHPELVEKVITMGSPFSGDPHANNAWRAYQLITGHRVDNPPVKAELAAKPPVETVAFWSPRDGIVSPRSACGRPGERDRAVALRCNHLGFAYSPECIEAVLRELEID
ncbi:MAG TPA: alpha/beta fold hydrolase [Alteraurantiacibacter sp.]|jgi:pimeloyl-ACP methyl ester carboxylesterase